MKKEKNRTLCAKLLSAVITGLSLSLTFATLIQGQQGQPELQITSPASGTVVNPGQAITVSVTSPAGISFAQVAVIGEDPVPSADIVNSVPAQFFIAIPNSLGPRKYHITAIGKSSSGQLFASQTISIDVERPDTPTGIATDRPQVAFQSQGQQTRLRVLATFADGTVLDVTESSNVTYASANGDVATVDSNGIVTGIGTGSTYVSATYRQGTSSLLATVSISVPPPVLSPSPNSLSFGNQAVGTNSPSQSLSVTNVSKNQGLKISGIGATGDFSETDNCVSPTPLAVGGICTINVTFSPTVAGSRTGAINVSNSQTIIPLAVPLTATGITSSASLVMGPQAMEGNLTLSAGGILAAGYDFTMPGSHPTATVSFVGAKVTFAWKCVSGPGSGVLVVPMADQSYTDPQNSPAWYPSGDQNSSLVYQGSIAVSNVCSGGPVNFHAGGTFSAGISSTDIQDNVNVRWHYSGGGSAGGWSGTQSVVP